MYDKKVFSVYGSLALPFDDSRHQQQRNIQHDGQRKPMTEFKFASSNANDGNDLNIFIQICRFGFIYNAFLIDICYKFSMMTRHCGRGRGAAPRHNGGWKAHRFYFVVVLSVLFTCSVTFLLFLNIHINTLKYYLY